MFRRSMDAELGADGSAPSSLNLTFLQDGESARIVGLTGGTELVGRLESMGMMPGTVIEKKSSALRRGPIVVGRGGSQLAIAYSIARSILVEPLR